MKDLFIIVVETFRTNSPSSVNDNQPIVVMTQLPDALAVVEEWKKKGNNCSGYSSDPLVSVMMKGFQAMTDLLTDPLDCNQVRSALASVDSERLLSMQIDDTKDEIARGLMYGFIESVHLTLRETFEEKCKLVKMIDDFTGEKEVVQSESVTQEQQLSQRSEANMQCPLCEFHTSAVGAYLDHFTKEHSYPSIKTELNDPEQDVGNPLNDISVRMDEIDESENDRGDSMVQEDGDSRHYATDDPKDSSEKKRRSARFVDNNPKYSVHLENSDDDSVTPVKKPRSRSEGDNIKSGPAIDDKQSKSARKGRRSDTDLQCPECEYRTQSTKWWDQHLRKAHSTTPSLAGLALRCECGHESFSHSHSLSRNFKNATVIRKNRMATPNSPKCVVCEAYPTSAYAYIMHLYINHHTSLKDHGIYIACGCGAKLTYYNSKIGAEHRKKECDGRTFAIHKLDEE